MSVLYSCLGPEYTLFLVKAVREALFQVSWNLISRDKASSRMMKSSGLSTGLWCKPNFTFTNTNTAPYILVHSCNFHNPFLNTKLSHCRSDHFLRNLVGRLHYVHESHINLFAYRKKFLLQLADDKDCICCACLGNTQTVIRQMSPPF